MKKSIHINIILILSILTLNISYLVSKVTVALNKEYNNLNIIYNELNDENWPPQNNHQKYKNFPVPELMYIDKTGTISDETQLWISQGTKSSYSFILVKKNSFTVGDTLFEEFYVKEMKFVEMLKKVKFPKVKFSELTKLEFIACNFTGGLTNIVAPKLDSLILSNCMSVKENDLKLDLPKLKHFWATTNDKGKTRTINGFFDNSLLPNLEWLVLPYQGITSLVDVELHSPKIKRIDVSRNKLMPLYLEKLIDLPNLKNGQLFYDEQTPDIPYINKVETLDSITYSYPKEKILGEYNIFTWQEYVNNGWYDIKDSPDKLKLMKPVQKSYRMSIKNSKLPRYTLYSASTDSAKEINNCWENDYFKICLPVGGFEENKDGILSANGNAILNDFVQIDGKIVIDPNKLNVKIDGRLYLKDLPLISGGIGEIQLADGKYELALLGNDGKITNFLNGLAKNIPDVGGLKFKIKDLEFVGGKKPSGIKISAVVEWDNIRKGCSDKSPDDDGSTSLELNGLEISKEKGWNLEAAKLENFGLMPKWCVKEFSVETNEDENTITFGVQLQTPFVEIGGGLGFKNKELDSIGLSAEFEKALPLGTTSLGLYGGLGAVWNIAEANYWSDYNFKLGGIIGHIANKDLLMFKAVIGYDAPFVNFGIEEANIFKFKDENEDEKWLATGSLMGKTRNDWLIIGLDGELKVGPYKEKKDDEDEKHILETSVNISYKTDVDIFTGKLKGKFTVPKLATNWNPIYKWMNKKFGLPYSANGNAFLLYKESAKYINGSVKFSEKTGDIQFVINLSQYGKDNFLIVKFDKINITGEINKNQDIILSKTHNFDVNKNSELIIVYINGEKGFNTILIDPNGNQITASNLPKDIEFNIDNQSNEAFWTLYNPQSGNWRINYDDNQKIEVYQKYIPKKLNISAKDNGNNVLINWDNINLSQDTEIDFFVDSDNDGLDGYYVGKTKIGSKSFTFAKNQSDGLCQFYVYAITNDNDVIISNYAPELIKSSMNVEPPKNLRLEYNRTLKFLDIKFDFVNNDKINFYTVRYADTKETIKTFFKYQNSARVYLKNFDTNRVIEIISVTYDDIISCPAIQKAVVGIDEELILKNDDFLVFPNPFKNFINIKGNELKSGYIQIVDIQGRTIFTKEYSDNEIQINLTNLINGIYILRIIEGMNIKEIKLIKMN